MSESTHLDPRHLRIGLYVQLELSWLQHPFPLNHFRLATEQQLRSVRELGLERVRVLLDRSEPEALRALVDEGLIEAALAPQVPASATPVARPAVPEDAQALARRARKAALDAERALASVAERRFADAARVLKRSLEGAVREPVAAREQCEGQVHALLDSLLGEPELAIRLLGDGSGDRAAMHAVNTTVISLLLGHQMGLTKLEMFDMGLGAMLHDVGKIELPDRVRWIDSMSSRVPSHERQFYREHVTHGVEIGHRMGLAPGAMQVLAQHHELADGTGFPQHLSGHRIASAARIVALVNRYDNLCNPASPADALTPHEALATMYGQSKAKFDAAVFGGFIRMMGIYPPGSVVQLSDERHALVVGVNASKPMKPRVLVHEPGVPRDEALPIDLETTPALCIRRSLKPEHLPRAILDYLSPRLRTCYFFERAREPAFELEEACA